MNQINKSSFYWLWRRMHERGEVCEKWRNYENFCVDLYPSYERGDSIRREKKNLPFSPNNAILSSSQKRNTYRESSVLVTIKGETRNIKQWCKVFNLKYGAIIKRIHDGRNPREALKKKVNTYKRKFDRQLNPISFNSHYQK